MWSVVTAETVMKASGMALSAALRRNLGKGNRRIVAMAWRNGVNVTGGRGALRRA